ncbi:Rpn family recombination-promoting nuclease/putative transposase [Hyalangium sp.]|uniref:Rpn family recombination-promoting nuclease/putative transposase n=1 Tax=Hyalangium sp. TaxID=2028555 RepID=UPI002D5A9F49|nr:Rpn family recombination-promoting nuclease/putative transposase [Hyalangium sp.]HYI00295.1 Rpn family recombination-promoting nuclease/putative transposase [Hyalangium sp.]
MSGPHDRLVRFTFDHPERAATELRAALPAFVVSQVDWASLQPERGSVVDPELRETETDLLFSARLRGGRAVLFYMILEHQSSVDRWMALRILRYVVRQLEHWRQEHPGSELMPIVIPLVMYHGPGGAWSAPRRVEALFDVPDEQPEQWRALVPHAGYLLDDLTTAREEALKTRPGPPMARLVLLALVYGRSEQLAQRLPGWGELFTQAHGAPNGAEEVSAIFHYLLLVGEEGAKGVTVDMLRSVVGAQRTEELMSAWFEEHFEQGRQKGRDEGLAKGRAEDVLRILAVRGVHVDTSARQRILSCTDLATLGLWLERAVNATHISEVLAQ